MNIKNKVSIIVPCYNVELYVSKCVESLINQTYENIEIILINDGSKDNTFNILNSYKEKDQRIIIIDKKNSGVSSARNDGIKKASGEYLLFVDSDDYIDNNMVEILIKKANENNADIVKCNRADVYLNKNYIVNRKPIWNEEKKFIKKDFSTEIYVEFFNRNRLCNIWMTLIKKDLLKTNNILFNENLYVNEDEVFSAQIFSEANIFVYLPDILYFYVKNDNGLSSNGADIYKRYESRKKHSMFIKTLGEKWNIEDKDNKICEKIALLGIHTLFQTTSPNINYSKKEQFKLFKIIIKDDIFNQNLNNSKSKLLLFPEKILLVFIKCHLYNLGFIYSRFFEWFLKKYRYKFEKIRKE